MTSECPGEGICERFTGAAGETDEERFEEASPGCERNCKSLRRQAAESSSEDSSESDLLISDIENLYGENRAFPFSSERLENLEYFQFECVIFWQKTVDYFERDFQATLRIVAASFLKK